MELLEPIKDATRNSETDTHFLVISFGKQNHREDFLKYFSDLSLEHGHPNISEFHFDDITIHREDEQEFLKEFSPIINAGYFPRKFIKTIQFILKHLKYGKRYMPIDFDKQLKLNRTLKHKLLNYFPMLLAYRRH
jgi:hypothetical protein